MPSHITSQPMTSRQALAAFSWLESMHWHSYALLTSSCVLLKPWLRHLPTSPHQASTHRRLSCIYALQVEEGTPFARRYSAGKSPLPTDDAAASMYCSASAVLGAAGTVGATCTALPAQCWAPQVQRAATLYLLCQHSAMCRRHSRGSRLVLITSCLCVFPWSAARSRLHKQLHVPLCNIVPLMYFMYCRF